MKKILCVDDDLSLLHLYREEFTEEGYKVILAEDGKQAMEKFKEEKPQAVVMDIRMPLMDGIETLNAMLGDDRQMPIILNTAFPQYRENFMTWGAEAYVIKSSDLTELKQKVREVLDKRKKRRNLDPQADQHYREKSKSRRLLDGQMNDPLRESGSSSGSAAQDRAERNSFSGKAA